MIGEEVMPVKPDSAETCGLLEKLRQGDRHAQQDKPPPNEPTP